MAEGTETRTLTDKALNDKVDGRIRHLITEKDPQIVDLVKGVAREMISDPEVLGMVVDSTERSNKSWQSKSDADRLATLAAARQSPEERDKAMTNMMRKVFRGQPIARGVQHLPVFRRHTPVSPAPLGTGEVTTRALLYAFKSYEQFKYLSWEKILEWAQADRDEQMVEIIKDAFENKGFINKDLQATDFSQGGAFVPAPVAVDFIAFLHGLSTLRELQPVLLNPTTDSVSMGRFASSVTAGWLGENEAGNSSYQTTEDMLLSRHDLEVKVIQSLRFLNAAPGGIEEMLQDDMRKAAKFAEEEAFLISPGSSNQPTGLKYLMDSANRNIDRTQAGTESTVEEIIRDVLGMAERVHGKNGKVLPMRPAYIGQHREKLGLMAAVDDNKQPAIFAEMLSRGELFFAKWGTTTVLEETLDVDSSGNADHTELFYVEMSEFVVADWLDMEIQEFREATVTDSAGNSRNLAETRSRCLMLTHSVDTALRHGRAAAHLKNVDWGADKLNA